MSIQEIIQSGVNVSITIGTNDLYGCGKMVGDKQTHAAGSFRRFFRDFFGLVFLTVFSMGGVVELVLRRTVREVLSCVDLFTTLIFLSLAILPSSM